MHKLTARWIDRKIDKQSEIKIVIEYRKTNTE